MNSDQETILIFTTDEEPDSQQTIYRSLDSAIKHVAAKASEVTVSTLQKNMVRFLTGLDAIISAAPKEVGGLTLDELDIHLQVDSKGNVGLSDFAGIEVGTSGVIKLVLRKKV